MEKSVINGKFYIKVKKKVIKKLCKIYLLIVSGGGNYSENEIKIGGWIELHEYFSK